MVHRASWLPKNTGDWNWGKAEVCIKREAHHKSEKDDETGCCSRQNRGKTDREKWKEREWMAKSGQVSKREAEGRRKKGTGNAIVAH